MISRAFSNFINKISGNIPTLSASVSGNALTVTLNKCMVDFRNAVSSSGTPIQNINVPTISITVPSSATLGTINSESARLLIIVAYNGGSPVLCISNSSGYINLDETDTISPTTISTGATSASTVYSASSVSAGSPYKVVGYVTITQAVAGTWVSAPTVVQYLPGGYLAGTRTALNVRGNAPMFACRAWVRTSDTAGTIAASGNVSSVANPSAGRFTVNFTVALPDSLYSYQVTARDDNPVGTAGVTTNQYGPIPPTSSACDFIFKGASSFNGASTLFSASFYR